MLPLPIMAARVDVSKMSFDGLYDYIWACLDTDVVRRETIEAFREAMVNGETFLEMTEEDVRELEPAWRKKGPQVTD